MNKMLRISSFAIPSVGALAILHACTPPRMPALELRPEKYCATSNVKIEYHNANVGITKIYAQPKIFDAFIVQTESDVLQRQIDISALPTSAPYIVTITMDVSPGSNVVLKKDIQILPPGKTETMTIKFPADCSRGDPPKWQVVEAPDKWDQAIKIQGVLNSSGRNITLSHNGGAGVVFSTNQLAGDFNGQSPSGTWAASTTLKTTPSPSGGEYFACRDATGTTAPSQNNIRRDPPDLSVEVTYGC